MTKKDYELVAKTIHIHLDIYYASRNIEKSQAIKLLAKDLAIDMALQDKRFKTDQFLKDCGIVNEPCKHLNFTDNKDGATCVDCGRPDQR